MGAEWSTKVTVEMKTMRRSKERWIKGMHEQSGENEIEEEHSWSDQDFTAPWFCRSENVKQGKGIALAAVVTGHACSL